MEHHPAVEKTLREFRSELCAELRDEPDGLTRAELRAAIRSIDDITADEQACPDGTRFGRMTRACLHSRTRTSTNRKKPSAARLACTRSLWSSGIQQTSLASRTVSLEKTTMTPIIFMASDRELVMANSHRGQIRTLRTRLLSGNLAIRSWGK